MKLQKGMAFLLCFTAIVFISSCTKDTTSSSKALITDAQTNASQEQQVLSLTPGPLDNASASVFATPGYLGGGEETDSPTDSTLSIQAWPYEGIGYQERSFIRFDGLAQIPATAKVRSAVLHLSGIDPGNPEMPQGNSVYKGSGYSRQYDNSVLVQGITQDWNASTITFNMQPTSISRMQDTIPRSTTQWNYDAAVNVTEIVQYQVSHPQSNFGFELKEMVESEFRCMGFCSTKYPDSTKRPLLVIKYN